jgi:hypothetical protein
MAARRDPEVLALLEWWAEKCRLECRVDFAAGLFTDQRWMDLAPGLVSTFERLRQPTLNLAYWNLHGRAVAQTDGVWTVDGEPLGFFHFSGFDPRRADVLSKHQNRVQVTDQSPLARLLAAYAKAMIRNGFEAAQQQPYAHDRFASGRAVTQAMRRRALRAAETGEPAPQGLGADAEAWLDAADPGEAADGLPDVTRLMAQVWRDDPAAAGIGRDTQEGRLAFHAWFAATDADARAKAAARALLAEHGESVRQAGAAPWRTTPWRGQARNVSQWFWQGPREGQAYACAAIANARSDLRRRFAGDDQGLLAWCIGVEAQAGRFAIEWLAPETITAIAQDPARLREAGRLAAPKALRTDLARDLFTAFTLAKAAGWPASWTEPVQAAFARPEGTLPAPFIAAFKMIWASRPDLQRLFPLATFGQRLAFLRWLVGGGLAEYGVDPAALPPAVLGHPLYKLARLSVRSQDAPARAPAAGACGLLVVVEDGQLTPGLPPNAVIYRAGAGSFHQASGAPRGAPRMAGLVAFAVDPELVPADALALRARGVEWQETTGVWGPDAVARLSADHPALSFVDRITTEATAPDLFRPAEPPTRTLAGLTAP